MTRFLDVDEVILINRRLTGSDTPPRDVGLVMSAVGRPTATMFGADLYPTLHDKAAALLQSLARNHPFVDGNKRTAWLAVIAFLRLNGVKVRAGQDEVVDFVLAVATGDLDTTDEIATQLTTWSV